MLIQLHCKGLLQRLNSYLMMELMKITSNFPLIPTWLYSTWFWGCSTREFLLVPLTCFEHTRPRFQASWVEPKMSTDCRPLMGQGVTSLDDCFTRTPPCLKTHQEWPCDFIISVIVNEVNGYTQSHRPSSGYTIASMSSIVVSRLCRIQLTSRDFWAALLELPDPHWGGTQL